MQSVVKLVCRGSERKPHDERIVARFRWTASGSIGWHRIGGSAHLRAKDITGAMLWGDSSAADGRHDVVCKGCGRKLDRTGDKLVPGLNQAREHGDKLVFLDQLN